MMSGLTPHLPVPRPSYSQARENLVRAIPPKLLCLLACGGKDCRYEGPECWKSNQQVIRGLFSSWVTNDIIAMARPSNQLIEKYNIIEQFQRLKIKSIINMQLPGEHAHCGPSLDPESGFTYRPQTFMDNNIYFYNFGMPDFGVTSLVGLIDGVKVLAFAVQEGRVAVHCHAGLGRTGVLIACYLIYTLRISPSEAVHFVRIKRPRSIQTRAQIKQVFDFARLLGTQLVQYPDLSLRHGAPFTLQHYLNRQALLLHGQEARKLRHTPKVVYLLCVRLSCLALGLPSPPEVHAELERRSALRILGRTVRETLVSKQYLPLLKEHCKAPRSSSGSVSSWDEPMEFLERRWEVLLDKRSYSDSDLSRITEKEEVSSLCTAALRNEKHWCVQDLIQAGLRPVSPVFGQSLSTQLTAKRENPSYQIQECERRASHSCWKRTKCSETTGKQKFASNQELNRNPHNPSPTSVARLVAKAMAEPDPPGESILQRSTLLQEELNSSDCGWSLLVTESDPHVLSWLLWTWLEKLLEPVLNNEDVAKLYPGGSNMTPLGALKKSQRHTIYCLLSCVSTVVSVCPHREDAVLQRLMCALTKTAAEPDELLNRLFIQKSGLLEQHPQEEVGSFAALMKVLKASLRETFHNKRHLMRACSTNAAL